MINLKEKKDLSNYTLVIPSVAVGNVGQLTVDLLISSLSLSNIGSVIDLSFIPVVGPDPYKNDSINICKAIDIYIDEDAKIVVFQMRSMLTRKPVKFFQELCQFVQENKIEKVVILTSSYDQEKSDQQIRTSPLRYVASEKLKSKYNEHIKTNSWLELEKKEVDFVETANLQIPGGGYALDLYEVFNSKDIPCIILVKFCSEGDNIPDALDLLNYFNQLIPVLSSEDKTLKVTYPSSWQFLFGNSPPTEIY